MFRGIEGSSVIIIFIVDAMGIFWGVANTFVRFWKTRVDKFQEHSDKFLDEVGILRLHFAQHILFLSQQKI